MSEVSAIDYLPRGQGRLRTGHDRGQSAVLVDLVELRSGPLADGVAGRQEDVRKELLLEGDDPGLDGLELGLDDQCQSAPPLPFLLRGDVLRVPRAATASGRRVEVVLDGGANDL